VARRLAPLAVGVLLALVGAFATSVAGPSPGEAGPTMQPPPPALPSSIPGPPYRAMFPAHLATVPLCDTTVTPSQVCISFYWRPGDGNEQWLDISLYNNGFAPGTFVGRRLDAKDGYYEWVGLLAGTTYYWRVNAHGYLPSAGINYWLPSLTYYFTTRSCQ
jgi:hypothetical protein